MSDVKNWFKKAVNLNELEERILEELTQQDFNLSKTIWGTSLCSDEVNNSFNVLSKHFAGPGPFRFGGLAGFPFAGKTGFGAFAAHIPDQGSAFILYGPHIGFSESGSIGEMQREGQENTSTCCGSLIAGLETVKNHAVSKFDADGDYQQARVLEFLDKQQKQILESEDPIITVTEVAYSNIREEMLSILRSGEGTLNGRKVMAIGGIAINTDSGDEDLFEVRNVDVFS